MDKDGLAPILLFTYKRLDTLKKTVEALKQNYLADRSDLYIFSDAAKTANDEAIIFEIRRFLKTITGFKSVIIFENVENKGLAKSIIDGVSKIISVQKKVIVLEDDLITTPNFLNFMNTALIQYEKEGDVFSISGYSFNLGDNSKVKEDAYFLNRGWSWGWATWSSRWDFVDWDVTDYKGFINDKIKQRDFAKGGSDLNSMLHKQMQGRLDSWAIRWFYHQFNIKGLTLYPVFSKIYNIGFDNVATHTTGSGKRYLPKLDVVHSVKFQLPKITMVSYIYQKRFQDKMGILSRIKSKIDNIIKQFFNKTTS